MPWEFNEQRVGVSGGIKNKSIRKTEVQALKRKHETVIPSFHTITKGPPRKAEDREEGRRERDSVVIDVPVVLNREHFISLWHFHIEKHSTLDKKKSCGMRQAGKHRRSVIQV